MTNREEIERIKLKVTIHKRAYNSFFNQFMMNLIILLINIPFIWISFHGWWNAIATGALIMSLAYVWIQLSCEYTDLKFYTITLNRLLLKDEDEIDRLNNLLRLKIYDKDMKNAP